MKIHILPQDTETVMDMMVDDREALLVDVQLAIEEYEDWRRAKNAGPLIKVEKQAILEFILFKIDTAPG